MHGTGLKYFVEVARTGSLAAASQSLHVATSAISRQIAQLEGRMGVVLFDRMPRGMVLTQPGELLAQQVRRSMLEIDSLLTELSAERTRVAEVVHIGCTGTFAASCLPEVMADFVRDHSRARFVLRSGTAAMVERWVTDGEVDVGLSHVTARSAAVNVVFSMPAPVQALLCTSHPLAEQRVLSLSDVLDYPLALPEQGTTIRQLFDLACATYDRQFGPVLVTDNAYVVRQFVAKTDGIALTSAVMARSLAAQDLLVTREVDEPILNQLQVQVATMSGRRLSKIVARFVEALQVGPAGLDRRDNAGSEATLRPRAMGYPSACSTARI